MNTSTNNVCIVHIEGKYVPAIAHTIHKNRDKAKMKLKGIAIGNGLCDPETMLNYADFLQSAGLIDRKQAEHFYQEQNKTLHYIKQGEYMKAFDVFSSLIIGNNSYLINALGFPYRYNLLLDEEPADVNYYKHFVQTPQSRKAMHVGQLPLNDRTVVFQHLLGTFMKSAKPWIAELMNTYKVTIVPQKQ